MRLIDADALKTIKSIQNADFNSIETIRQWLDSAPSIDIVRCQDCKYWVYNFNGCSRNPCTEPWFAEDFCSYGERKDDE